MARALLTLMSRTQGRTKMTFKRRHRGFTLVELAVVVTIVGVLSVIAVVGYRRLITSSKLTEAENMLSGIRVAQEQYKAERGIYANIGMTPCPAGVTSGKKVQWNPDCPGAAPTPNWRMLPVHSDGPVAFQYVTVAGPPGSPPNLSGFVNTTAADLTKPWYVVQADADLDGQGGTKTEVWTSSFGNQIFSKNVGE